MEDAGVEGEAGGGGGGDEQQQHQQHAFAAVRNEGGQQQPQPPPPPLPPRLHGNKKQNKHFSRQQNKNKKWKLNKFKKKQRDNGGKKKEQLKGGLDCGLLVGGKCEEKPLQTAPNGGGAMESKQQQSGGKNKHSNKNSLNSLMQVRNKRLQAVAKFFLPDKRPRKDCIIPPTKFLLGGNISDPLNLNSLQNESENAVTPKSSPIPTPPHYKNKIEVIIPPNINDPLHLLDPVDSVEYEMQLCSPMKRKQRARNKRKRKLKSDKNNQSIDNSSVGNASGQLSTSLSEAEGTTAEEAQLLEAPGSTAKEVDHPLESGSIGDRDKASRNLKLDLEICRKRRISESTCCSNKGKVRRIDSMDKIVSPVIPQPGAWKRGHWPTLPVGGRNRTRTQSCTSNSDEPPAKHAAPTESEVTAEEAKPPVPAKQKDESEQQETASKSEQGSKTKSPQNETNYHYGNYDRYYGYRNLNEFIDVRLKVFLRNPYLFRDKDVLDIGCNVGLMTIAVAKMLHTKSITGVDIDSKLIAKARRNLAAQVRIPPPDDPTMISDAIVRLDQAAQNEQQTPGEHSKNAVKRGKPHPRRKISGARPGQTKHHQQRHQSNEAKKGISQFFPISFPLSLGNWGAKKCQLDLISPDNTFPSNVIFKTMNYVLKDETLINYDTQQYDLILCLSVTKWMHLNFGDNGLKTAFKRMFNHLRPGGKLILEAQNWASYKKKKKLTDTIFENYKNIEFFPNRFHDFLLSPEVGFSHSYPLGIPRHLSKGFRRPIQLYVKGDFTPSQAQWSDTYHPQTPYVNHHNIYTDIAATTTQNHCMWGSTTPYQPSYSVRCTPSHTFMATSPYYNPRQTDSYQPSYDGGNRRGSYCFASPLYSTTWSPPPDLCHQRRSASNTPNSASFRSAENDDHYAQQSRHVYPPMEVFPLEPAVRLPGSASVRQTDSDSEPSSNSASQTPTRSQFDVDQSSNSPSTTHSQPDK
ncbi:7SK snRNA methylphosphate capping enzyme bin3 [Toxorhynchites rutilus septentrionalis]|uniref:7SK snRNA methylphosphate capping enzyme bin3 n=1 Tax=Toxorhynchites rutilus septentrionalis TaxID=329112 RepID=UPI00247971CD|nr:7SK snRNA methylphosphate capping enzyme bin3 [Toxorhynchites rutilus septentrionalis]